MFGIVHKRTTQLAAVGMLLATLILAACGSSSTPASSNVGHGAAVIVGGKLDPEAQLLTKMYVLLLRNAGYNVTEKARLGTNDIVFNAITSGQIDLYPEFTATGLYRLGQTPSSPSNPTQDFTAVSTGYESKYQITWLNAAPMNDSYGICLPKDKATSLKVTKISDLIPIAGTLTIATPPDGQKDPGALPGWDSAYGLNFKNVVTLTDEAPTFAAVTSGQADMNVCYTTNGLISKDNFVLLQDDKGVSPNYNPAPIVRDAFYSAHKEIAGVLNPLAPKLTTAAITGLNAQASADGSNITEVATTWLKSQGLLP